MAESRTKLLKFVALFACGGTERQFVNLGLSLDRDRFDLRFGCTHLWGHFLKDIQARQIPVNAYPIGSFASLKCAAEQLRLARYIAQQQIEIVHAYSFYGNVFALPAARLAAAPVLIASVRDQGAYLTPRQKAVQRLVCKLADCVLVNARAIQDWLTADGYDSRKIVVIPNGIDLSPFDSAVHGDVRQELGIPHDASLVSLVSRLSPTKGVEHLLEAIARIAPKYPKLRLLIVGEGLVARDGVVMQDREYLDQLLRRTASLGLLDRVVFTGYRADVAAILAESTVFALPSLSEGLSNVVLEAMAARVPVVATRVGGTPEIVRDGETGVLVPPTDANAMAAALSQLLDDPERAKTMGAAGRRTIEEKYSVTRMVQTTEQLYTDLLARKLHEHRRAVHRVGRIPASLLAWRRS